MSESLPKLLRELFGAAVPADLSTHGFPRNACVAALLRGSSLPELEVAFIRRSITPTDSWSGQLAFPGGGNDPVDADHMATVLREVQEEIGLDLLPDEFIGRLNDTQARRRGQMLEFYIRPFVFYLGREIKTVLNPDEVADFFWVPITDLTNERNQTTISFHRDEVKLALPAIQMKQDPPLWGLTYMMTVNLLEILGTAAANDGR